MYTEKKVRLISSILPDLTSPELQSLKEEIDSIIKTKSRQDTTEDTGDFINSNSGLGNREAIQESSRPLGIWKGKITISEDFYKTSSDILSEFGMEEE